MRVTIKEQAKRLVIKHTPDKWVIERNYQKQFGRKPNLINPKRFTEKIQWLKLHYRPNEMHRFVDKYEVRAFIADTIGPQFLNELIGVWDDPCEIDFDKLPNKFAMKATHASAKNLICTDKRQIDWDHEKAKLADYLNHSLYPASKEWAYKHAKPRIICESFLDENGKPPVDYKYFCFNGEPKFIQVDVDRFSGHKRAMMSPGWEPLAVEYAYPGPEELPDAPLKLDEQLGLARILSEPFPFVRVDFYCVHGQTYFGELTFYPESGYKGFTPDSWDTEIGSWLQLPSIQS